MTLYPLLSLTNILQLILSLIKLTYFSLIQKVEEAGVKDISHYALSRLPSNSKKHSCQEMW